MAEKQLPSRGVRAPGKPVPVLELIKMAENETKSLRLLMQTFHMTGDFSPEDTGEKKVSATSKELLHACIEDCNAATPIVKAIGENAQRLVKETWTESSMMKDFKKQEIINDFNEMSENLKFISNLLVQEFNETKTNPYLHDKETNTLLGDLGKKVTDLHRTYNESGKKIDEAMSNEKVETVPQFSPEILKFLPEKEEDNRHATTMPRNVHDILSSMLQHGQAVEAFQTWDVDDTNAHGNARGFYIPLPRRILDVCTDLQKNNKTITRLLLSRDAVVGELRHVGSTVPDQMSNHSLFQFYVNTYLKTYAAVSNLPQQRIQYSFMASALTGSQSDNGSYCIIRWARKPPETALFCLARFHDIHGTGKLEMDFIPISNTSVPSTTVAHCMCMACGKPVCPTDFFDAE